MLTYPLRLAGILFSIDSQRALEVDDFLTDFIVPDALPDVSVTVSWDWDDSLVPSSEPLGEDLICRYFRVGDRFCCYTRGGPKGPVACSFYSEDCRDIVCYMNEKPFIAPPHNLGSILRMIPIRAIFQRFGVIFFHASQILFHGRGILFTAPSGTGKSTQAKLWRECRGASILCGDRTLARFLDGWVTFGYPLDGSEPVRTTGSVLLGAVVLLAQGESNFVERLHPLRGAASLIEQTVIDTWNPAAKTSALQLILSMMESVPVYRLVCTPDERAVNILEKKLIEDEVI